ncbi:MAG: hypothetical protein DM484_12430 [Candidatus Methylumidiphilus alinenensis]|uniref:Uncharacterized protein n=1 Tax=Candidatus Methylumidiphilus alinenensis TaxID=2202197 RepID=A0A2W4SU29_9GAMM|nr:MAG: hypothetical protein DM484_12430 [Candidatus Methylumidiphilus alinenensis]
MPKSSVHGWQTTDHDRCPGVQGRETTGWQVILIKHLHNWLATVHGLDFGIPAEMTAFLA